MSSDEPATLFSQKPPPIKARVLAKRDLLKQWLEKGVPSEHIQDVPRNLREAREWNDPPLGIHRVGSLNDFVTTHREWGSVVAEIDSLFKELVARAGPEPQRKKSASRSNDDLHKKVAELQQLLQAVTSQWHQARDRQEELETALVKSQLYASGLETALTEVKKDLADARKSSNNVTPLRGARK